ncbi:OmpW/AlkL family protein [Azospira restricta]|uniref:OmpW family protein n=1 Tax=Azospira restricta TaxID=404405 RepID=A0A974Y3F1_9RHOO|nr:OmpW family outer membrane protein [Azospira restricta]QRJ63873.1 OmpW family protein [Azospira restricta]
MHSSLKLLALSAALAAALPAAAQQSAEGNWLVRVRAVHVDTANKSSAIPLLAVPSNAIHVENKTIPELDISYFFTKNIAAELILTVPQKHDVKVTGSALGAFKAGSFYLLPPTLTAQWHFNPDGDFRPYVGAGITYSDYSAVKLSVPGVAKLKLDNDYFGPAVQVGFDYKLTKNLFLNLDVKKAYVRSDLEAEGLGKVSRVKVDPLLIGVGLGWRF